MSLSEPLGVGARFVDHLETQYSILENEPPVANHYFELSNVSEAVFWAVESVLCKCMAARCDKSATLSGSMRAACARLLLESN